MPNRAATDMVGRERTVSRSEPDATKKAAEEELRKKQREHDEQQAADEQKRQKAARDMQILHERMYNRGRGRW